MSGVSSIADQVHQADVHDRIDVILHKTRAYSLSVHGESSSYKLMCDA
jgi:hypothetical protein